MLVTIYDYYVTYAGRKIEEFAEPPEHFIQTLCENLVRAAVLQNDVTRHSCSAECALNNYVIMGFPYTENLKNAVPRYVWSITVNNNKCISIFLF